MLKSIIQSFLARFNIRIARIPTHVIPSMPFNVLEYVVAKLVNEVGTSFRFIQVGANDGVLCDNLAPIIRKYNIRGCLVEPLPDVFDRLKINYKDQPQLEFSNVLIGSENCPGVIYRFKPNSPVPHDFYHGLARQDISYIRRRAASVGLSDQIEEIRVAVRSFESLYQDLNYECLHLLYIDTEGMDDMVVYQALDAKIYPFVIVYEWSEIDLARNFQLKLRLLDEGYRFIDIGADTICVRESP